MREHERHGDERSSAARGRVPAPQGTGPHGVPTLQALAGNGAVQRAMGEGGRSPVLDVVGRGGGSALAPDVREDMEARLGADFSDVRVHTGGTAASSAAAVGAHAYTVGRDVVFGAGRFDTSSTAGRTMLAHELTHVVQQRRGPVSGTPTGDGVSISDPSDRFEREAEANATRVMRSPSISRERGVSTAATAARPNPAVQRGGAVATPGANTDELARGVGVTGIQGLIDLLARQGDRARCILGVMVRYPEWGNYLWGKGGHAAIQVQVDVPGQNPHYLQVGVSATGTIQVEPVFQTFKTRDGYSITRLTSAITPASCTAVLRHVAKEIATDQPYRERIVYNSGQETNCALWACGVAAVGGLNLQMGSVWFLPSPNDLRKQLAAYHASHRATTALSDSTVARPDDAQIDTDVGVVAYNPDGSAPMSQEQITRALAWARSLGAADADV